jgi:hypothetical protein
MIQRLFVSLQAWGRIVNRHLTFPLLYPKSLPSVQFKPPLHDKHNNTNHQDCLAIGIGENRFGENSDQKWALLLLLIAKELQFCPERDGLVHHQQAIQDWAGKAARRSEPAIISGAFSAFIHKYSLCAPVNHPATHHGHIHGGGFDQLAVGHAGRVGRPDDQVRQFASFEAALDVFLVGRIGAFVSVGA